MAERTRRIGCGCLPVVGIFVVGAAAAILFGDADAGEAIGGLALVLFGGFVAMVLLALFARRRRQKEREHLAAGESAKPVPTAVRRPRPSEAPSRSEREVRSGTRDLATEPESEEAQTLKRRLSEAVADLADNVENMPTAGEAVRRGKTSDEMIAEAKRRIADRHRQLDR